ncbi:hypothetical protein ACEQ8H_006783 [Pleosporales sp. CAS-2024a]
MLARASSDAGTRLRRSESTSTVHKHSTPAIARQQAIAAATVAFARAHAYDAADRTSKRSSEMARSKSSAGRKSLAMQGQGSHFPARGSSFRASNHDTARQDAAVTRPAQVPTSNTEKFPLFYPLPEAERPVSAPRPLSNQPSIAVGEHSRPNTQPKMGRQGASSSATSQQIRKARSMYYASSVQTGSPIARPPTMYLATPPQMTVEPSPEVLARTTSARILPPSPLASPRVPVTVEKDETVDHARDKYLQSFQQRSVKHKPSLFMAPFKKRQDKGKDKNSRATSGLPAVSSSVSTQITPHESAIDVTLIDFMPHPDPKSKRLFSGSLKSKIKRVFRRTSKPLSNLPVQQIQASRDYFSSDAVENGHAGDVYAIPSPDENILHRVRARTPSYEPSRPLYTGYDSRSSSNGSARSNRSLHSEAHAANILASRVTSWGTTSTQDTAAQRSTKRLTVIHESKDSISSAADHALSALTKRKSLPPGSNLASFRDPMPMDRLVEESSTPIDPKRVFSALMKEIKFSKATDDLAELSRTPGAESDVFESSKTKNLHSADTSLPLNASQDFHAVGNEQRPTSRRAPSAAAHSTQSKASSIRTIGRVIRSTIRNVTPSDQRSSPCPVPPASNGGTVHIPAYDLTPSAVATPLDKEEDCINLDKSRKVSDPPQVFSPSREQIERRVSKVEERWKTPLDDVAYLRFPRETERTYRVAEFTQDIVKEDHCRRSLEHLNKRHTDIPDSPCSPPPRATMSPLSPSIYSRNTDGVSILPNDSVISFGKPDGLDRHHHGGSAVILTSQSIRSYVVGTPSPHRPDSANSNRDWKAWLSHEVSSMEFTSQEDLKIDEQYLTPSGKHHRNSSHTSHTDQDETTVILRPSCDTVTPHVDLETLPADAASAPTITLPVRALGAEGTTLAAMHSGLEKSQSHMDACREVTPESKNANVAQVQETKSKRLGSTPLSSRQRPLLTPRHTSSRSQPLVETPRSAFMNERFPFIDTGRRSSNNSATSSRKSRSPPDSIASSLRLNNAAPSPKFYSDFSAPSTQQRSQGMYRCSLMKLEDVDISKENLTPPCSTSVRANGRPKASPLGTLQPLTSMQLNRGTLNASQYTANDWGSDGAQAVDAPAAAILRPRILALVRAISPEKAMGRPKSAFELRAARPTLPRPASEFRRPALHLKSSVDSFAESREPSPGAETRAIDSILEASESSDSITTPGQRMADRFLRERQSTGVLESGGKHRGGLMLVREDTPAFL